MQPVPPALAGANAHVARRGADALGWSGSFIRRNATEPRRPRRGRRVHGSEGVYVCDGSAIPSSLGVNAQITIMTLATRLAAHLCHS